MQSAKGILQKILPIAIPIKQGPCLVQGWLDDRVSGVRRIGSPSVQMFLSEEELFLFDITEQFLREEIIHEGNVSPPPYLDREIREELLSQTSKAGHWLHAQGYRGTASTDFLVMKKDGKTRAIICEINARITGATYPAILARHFLPQRAWLMRNLRFSPSLQGFQLLSDLDRSGLLFSKGGKQGVLPCNFNLDEHGKVHKGQFVFLASGPEQCRRLLTETQAVFPLICTFDRD